MDAMDTSGLEPRTATTICRIEADGIQWRVRVEAWEAAEGCEGRLVFEPESPRRARHAREGGATLRGPSRADVVASAYQLPEGRLRKLVHSLV